MIQYIKGDATSPKLSQGETGLVAHVVNTRGGWGRGFVLAVSSRWYQPEAAYRRWHRTGFNEQGEPFRLGNIQYQRVEPQLYVVNMLAQAGYLKGRSRLEAPAAIRLDALEACLEQLARLACQLEASVHMPRIGTGLGGGSWDLIEPVIDRQLKALVVTVYDYSV